MARRFRVIDTGLRAARRNIAFDQALIEARSRGLIPDTIRFLRFRPSALVGVHQVLGHEVRLDHCRRHGIEVARRITGGGGLYLDEGQLGWELVFDRSALAVPDLPELTRRICEAAALGLRRLGVDAHFRPRNDIEVDGRKISGTGGVFNGNTLFFQGTLLVDFDVDAMISALKVPAAKLAKRDLANARDRVVSLRALLGERVPSFAAIKGALLAGFAEGLGITPVPGPVTEAEERLADQIHDDEIGTEGYVRGRDAPEAGDRLVSASLAKRGGTLRADIRLEGARGERIREALLTGDFFLSPARAILDLEAALRGLEASAAGAAVEDFFARTPVDMPGLAAADFREAVEAALSQMTIRVRGQRLRGHMIGPVRGGRPTLVFLHDALGCVRLWRDVPHALAKATGLGGFAYDRLGSGDSDALAPPFSRDYLVEEATEWLPAVLRAAGLRRVLLVGHSDGATIALIAAGAHPDKVEGVISLAGHLFSEPRTLAAIGDQIAEFESGDLRQRLARYHGAKVDTLFRRLVEAWTGEGLRRWGAEPWLARIRCPVLAIQGADDEFFTAAQLAAIAEAAPGRIETLLVPDCGHVPHHQARQPVLVAMTAFARDTVRGSVAGAP